MGSPGLRLALPVDQPKQVLEFVARNHLGHDLVAGAGQKRILQSPANCPQVATGPAVLAMNSNWSRAAAEANFSWQQWRRHWRLRSIASFDAKPETGSMQDLAAAQALQYPGFGSKLCCSTRSF